MKIFGIEIRKSKAAPEIITQPQVRNSNPQGPMTAWFQNYVMRKVSGDFYEVLREGIPLIDSAIRRLISLNGTIKIIGDNTALVKELEDFCLSVPVNDTQKGIHAFLENASNETFEQGFSLSEFVATKDMKDIAGLRVADSKDIIYRRNADGRAEPWYRYPGNLPLNTLAMPGTLVDRILNASYGQTIYINGINEIKLDPLNKIYFSINNENSNPYGVSIMRSMEFCAQILMTIQNSFKHVFERFGDPSFHVHYKSSKTGSNDNLEARRQTLQTDWNNVINAKRSGKSADLVTAGSLDTEVVIKVIGADNQIIIADIPLRHVLEQIVSKTNLPAWMLGIYWSTTERMATLEVESALQDAKIRQLTMLPEFIRLFSVILKMRGRKWNTITTNIEKPGDWGIIFETPNLRDLVAQAQARFLNAQADMMGSASTQTTVNVGAASAEIRGMKFPIRSKIQQCSRAADSPLIKGDKGGCCEHQKEFSRPIPWPELDAVEINYENELKYDWEELRQRVFTILKLNDQKDSGQAGMTQKGQDDIPDIKSFTFTEEQRAAIMKALENHLDYNDWKDSDSAVRWAYGQSYSLGLIQAVKLIGKNRPILDIIKNKEIYDELCRSGFTLLKNNAIENINDVISEMEAGMLAGSNPGDVAVRLGKLFGDQNSDWERLARSEMSMAAERAKLNEWAEWNIKKVEFKPAPDACPICFAVAGEYETGKCPIPCADTHPRCRCSIMPAESEV